VESPPIIPAPSALADLSKSWLLSALRFLTLVFGYALVSWIGQGFAYLPPGNISAFFPASGVALAGILTWGPGIAPAIWFGSLLGNSRLLLAGDQSTVGWTCSAVIGVGAVLQALVGASLFRRATGAVSPFGSSRDAAGFVAIPAIGASLIGPTLGVGSLVLFDYVSLAGASELWLTWWLGEATGVILAAPLLLAWGFGGRFQPTWGHAAEGLLLAAMPVAIGRAIVLTGYPLEYLYLPTLTWAAFRFGPRGATTLTTLVAGVAIATTMQGFGSFFELSPNLALLLLQSFLGTAGIMTLLLVGVIAQRDAAEKALAYANMCLEARVRLRTQELAALNGRLRRIAESDGLTGVTNRRSFDVALEAEWRRCGRNGLPLAVILMDIDHFKAFNDNYGHQAGDDCLRRVAEVLANSLQRSGELLARYGGEEFVALLPGSDLETAAQIAERLRRRVAGSAIPHGYSTTGATVSLSAGVSAIVPTADGAWDALVSAADGALYAAKRAGRNCVSQAR
jgi:diguanylate cyclase (GGDEF)-like protein